MDHSPRPIVVLMGPWGVGKTVLLDHSVGLARKLGIHVANVNNALLSGEESNLINHMFPQGLIKGILEKFDRNTVAGAFVDLDKAENKLIYALPVFLSKGPLLIVLDDAHTCEPEALKLLFDCLQQCMYLDLPLAVIIAGASGIEPHLQRCDASYEERARFLRFNTLSQEETKEALEAPAREGSRPIDPDALELLADWTDCHPFFIQLAGEQAWNASVARGGNEISATDANAGLDLSYKSKRNFFDMRLKEIDNDGQLPQTLQVIDILRADHPRLSRGMLASKLMELNDNMDRPSALAVVDRLLELGFLWREVINMEPGIPSMFDHIRQEHKVRHDGQNSTHT